MAKLKVYRKSGVPVKLEDREAYQKEWEVFYDKVKTRAGLDMLKTQRMLAFGERQLIKKYNVEVLVEMPKSAKGWEKLIAGYEDTPIMLARTTKGNEVVAIIMDEQF
jgi:hypothetical protein